MSNQSENSRTLVKNTLFLYVRMMFSLVVSLYTSRAILQYLGVEDFGIYNAVGGIVGMFGIISGSLSTAISRTLTFELGTGNLEKLKRIFSMSINVQLLIIVVIFLLGETLAVWFLNNRMVVPDDRIVAANWVLQFSLITFSLNLFSVPYNASLIAHEKMNIFAYIGILEVVLKLLIVFMLMVSPIDKLVFYGLMLMLVAVLVQCIYSVYCNRNFEECRYQYKYTRDIKGYNEIFSFATWNFIGSTSSILRSQGINILLNVFFGPVVNAARAISMQVNGAINAFVGNFMVALTPQITKSYAQGNYSYLLKCIYRGSKFSFFLLYLLSLPVLMETDYILKLWLVSVPDTTVGFVRYILLFSLADTYSRTLINANNATGDIKLYQIVVGGLNLTVLPIAYIILKLGASAESTVLVSVFIALIGIFPRIYFNKKHFPITYKEFTYRVIMPTVIVGMVGMFPPYIALKTLPETFLSFLIVTFICLVSSLLSILFVGCSKEERSYIVSIIKRKVNIKL